MCHLLCMCFSAINGSGPAYLSELLHVYTPSRTLRSSSDTRMLKIQQYKRKTIMAFAPSLALDTTFGIHPDKTLFRLCSTLSSFKTIVKTYLFS